MKIGIAIMGLGGIVLLSGLHVVFSASWDITQFYSTISGIALIFAGQRWLKIPETQKGQDAASPSVRWVVNRCSK